jgi:PIN domain nuclease of toxin-antitoxin system
LIVLDTHALVWWVTGARELSQRAKRAIRERLRQGPVFASAISVMEIATAVRRGRLVLAIDIGDWLRHVQQLPELQFEPVSADIAHVAGSFDDAIHGDPADRIIVATARALGARLVTADARLRRSTAVHAVW